MVVWVVIGKAYVVEVLPPSLSGDLAAALRKQRSATIDSHNGHSCQALPMPGLR
jgi:hypothetical protein